MNSRLSKWGQFANQTFLPFNGRLNSSTRRDTGDDELAQRLKWEFQEDYCLSVNNENEKETYQILVNTLEDRSNRIRANLRRPETQRRLGRG